VKQKPTRIGAASLALLVATGMEAKADEFFAHGDARDAKPAGGLGLIATGELDRLGE
jgi:hypothetical protein